MFKNYLKTAIRNLLKQKLFSLINIFGLAVGVACCILIFLFVQHEWQHEAFHENGEKIYRALIEETGTNGEIRYSAYHEHSLAEGFKENFSAINHASGFITSDAPISFQENNFGERIALVENDFLQMFTFPLLAGNKETALAQPNNVLITKELAEKLFTEAADFNTILGKVVTFNRHTEVARDFIISGVLAPLPKTSSLQFSALIPIEHHESYPNSNDWGGYATVYLQLSNADALDNIAAGLPAFAENYCGDRMASFRSFGRVKDTDDGFSLVMQPLKDIYLNSKAQTAYEDRSKAVYSYILGGIAIFVLLIACINFMTLSIGRSVSRGMEVGVRKVLGARRLQLMKQFWGEAFLLCAMALAFGIALAEFFLPVFNGLTHRELSLSYIDNWQLLVALLVILGLTGTIAGSYPAFVLSGFSPVTVFKGGRTLKGKNRFTRTLVVAQYSLAILLMTGTFIVSQQLQYMRSKDLGYNKEQVVMVNLGQVNTEQLSERYKSELLKHSQVLNVASSDRAFTRGSSTIGFHNEKGELKYARRIRIDENYLKALDLSLAEGRNFSLDFPGDVENSILVNETLVTAFGLKDPLNKPLVGWSNGNGPDPVIVGVVKDYHFDSLRDPIKPLVLTMDPSSNAYYYMLVRIQPENISATVKTMKSAWANVAPSQAFSFYFLDDELNRQYQGEARWQTILSYATGFALFISCLGLFGLTALAVSRRTKEIGIRKVLGAPVSSIVRLISKEFIGLVLIANFIAIPAAAFGMSQWLTLFAYHIDLSGWVFLFAALLTLLIALLTVSWHAIKAALTNPVDALHYE